MPKIKNPLKHYCEIFGVKYSDEAVEIEINQEALEASKNQMLLKNYA